MPGYSNLPTVHIDGRTALATRRALHPDELLRQRIDAVIQIKLAAQDPDFMRSLGVTKNGITGGAHRGLLSKMVKDHGVEIGDETLINADIDDVIKQFVWARNRTPAIRLSVLQQQALAMLTHRTVDPQADDDEP